MTWDWKDGEAQREPVRLRVCVGGRTGEWAVLVGGRVARCGVVSFQRSADIAAGIRRAAEEAAEAFAAEVAEAFGYVAALRNVRLLAERERRRAARGAPPTPDVWNHILRFCSEAGVVGSVLRACDEPNMATETTLREQYQALHLGIIDSELRQSELGRLRDLLREAATDHIGHDEDCMVRITGGSAPCHCTGGDLLRRIEAEIGERL